MLNLEKNLIENFLRGSMDAALFDVSPDLHPEFMADAALYVAKRYSKDPMRFLAELAARMIAGIPEAEAAVAKRVELIAHADRILEKLSRDESDVLSLALVY